eukprot:m.126697 g.126697  ORF g.126697 m.126697 type:complete len:78 (-) comp9396_c0_seq5:1568-1801(-)
MWEIAAQAVPWTEIDGPFVMDALLRAIRAGQRPAVDDSWPAEYVTLTQACWVTAPEQRSTFASAVGTLQALRDRLGS